jgi:hypothetical protein
MPNREVHILTSSVTGGVWALHRAGGQSPEDSFLEMVGGILGGSISGTMPDKLDPPTSPNHRALGHSAGVATLALPRIQGLLLSWESHLRYLADEVRKQRSQEGSDFAKILLTLLEIVLRIAVGIASGVVAGYSTHLVLDALTSKSLPLIA